MIVVGSAVTEHPDGKAILGNLAELVKANKGKLLNGDWNGYNVLQRQASRTGALDIGFTPSAAAAKATPKFIYLLNADDISAESIPRDAFVVYQGHHGDVGAQFADVCLPGSAYTEKATTYVNTEGRTQLTRAAVPPPGAAREDWKIVRALSEVMGATLPYDDILDVRDRMFEISPTLVRYDLAEPSTTSAPLAVEELAKLAKSSVSGAPLLRPIQNFYQTDPISRASPTMAKCTAAFVENLPMEQVDGKASLASFG